MFALGVDRVVVGGIADRGEFQCVLVLGHVRAGDLDSQCGAGRIVFRCPHFEDSGQSLAAHRQNGGVDLGRIEIGRAHGVRSSGQY